MQCIVVGGGPVGCVLALELRRRGIEVEVYDRAEDPRLRRTHRDHSFNLTLSSRGLRGMRADTVDRLYAAGVRLDGRVLHGSGGELLRQPYGFAAEHHLLSISRRTAHVTLLEEAERAGARIAFEHECVGIDAELAEITCVARGRVVQHRADLLFACDGANSIVRAELAETGRLAVSQLRSTHGYVELEIGPHAAPALARDALHIWPRGELLLIAQPNRDLSYTATLFMPLGAGGFADLRDRADVERLFRTQFPGVLELAPRLAATFHDSAPGHLKTVRCTSFHGGRTILLGDAAHTMLPFYGQGINCSFEDVRVLLEMLDGGDVRELTAARREPCEAITALSIEHRAELTRLADRGVQARSAIERELWRRDPSRFTSLYGGIAFSSVPYHRVVAEHGRCSRLLDAVCREFDVETQAEQIVDAYEQRERDPPPRAPHGLALSASQRVRLVEGAASALLHHELHATYPASYVSDSLDVAGYTEGRRLAASLREDAVPRTGARLDDLLAEILDRATRAGTIHPHPGFMAHVPSGGMLEGAVGEFLAQALNRFAGVWIAAPGLIELECNVIRWFCDLLGYGPTAFGYLTTSGSISNLMALMCACRGDPSTATVHTSAEAHYSVVKAARLLGIRPPRMCIVPARADLAMDLDGLARSVDEVAARGGTPTCVVATAGTTNTGAIDDLTSIAALCRERGMWMHTDACFGGFFRMTARGSVAFRGIEESDSIAVDGHKSLFLPHGNSALLVKRRGELRSTFTASPAGYLPGSAPDPEFVDFCNYGPELSRGIRGLSAWLPIKLHGIEAFARCLDDKLDLAVTLADELEQIPEIEVIRPHPLHLPVVVFGLRARKDLNETLCRLICASGRVYLTTTVLPEYGPVVRACVLNHRTERAQIDELIDEVRAGLESLRTCNPDLRVR